MLIILILTTLFAVVLGHGRLTSPPGRSTLWRLNYNTPPNYNDNQLFCGGFYVQWTLNGGKCGICGDPWGGPRDNEAGGKYATGTIAGNYTRGQIMTVTIVITATHRGYHEFRLCPINNPLIEATQECLDRYLLKQPNGDTRYLEPDVTGTHSIDLVLPKDLSCSQCVLQWKWNTDNKNIIQSNITSSFGRNDNDFNIEMIPDAQMQLSVWMIETKPLCHNKGNSYGCDKNNNCCIGCGPQEQFYGCADIAIGGLSGTSANGAVPTYINGPQACLIMIFFIVLN